MTVAFVFPGQGSQSVGMQEDLAGHHQVVLETYREASEILGFDLWDLVQNGPKEKLDETITTQPAMLTAAVATWRAWINVGGPPPAVMAGHSLGEYSALVAAGAMEFGPALQLVCQRAALMQAAVPAGEGAMAAILGLDDQVILEVCNLAAKHGVAEAVNFNSPGQVVVAGTRVAIEKVTVLAKEAGARRALMLPVSVPAHSSLMQPAGAMLADSFDRVSIEEPEIPVLCAVDGMPYAGIKDIRIRMKQQIFRPVRWVDTISQMVSAGVTSVVECGPGKVLTGLVRRIDRSLSATCIDTATTLQEAKDGASQ